MTTNPPPNSPVKQRPDAAPCQQCGKPTWSATGLCLKCAKGAPPAIPPPIMPAPVPNLPFRKPRLDEQGHINEDIPCRRCGYNLRGIPPHGSCPECEYPISSTFKSYFLSYCDPNWLEKIRKGASILFISFIIASFINGIMLFFIFGSAFGSPISDWTPLILLNVAILIAPYYGLFRLTSPESGSEWREQRFSARRFARWGGIAIFPSSAVFTIAFTEMTKGSGLMVNLLYGLILLGLLVIGVGAQVAAVQWMRQLSRRLPHPDLASYAYAILWVYGFGLGWIKLYAVAYVIQEMLGMWGGLIDTLGVFGCVGIPVYIGFGIAGLVLLKRFEKAMQKTIGFARQNNQPPSA